MNFISLFIFLFIGLSPIANAQQDIRQEEQRKLVHKRPPQPPPIDMNPPKTSERNSHDSEHGSEQLHQAATDAFEVFGGIGYANLKSNYDSSMAPKTSSQSTTITEGVGAEYGFNHEIAAGAALAYKTGWTSVSPSNTAPNQHAYGLSDPSIYVKGRFDFESSSLRLGGRLNFSLAKKYEDSDGNGNFYSGGLSLTPFVGYEYYYLQHTFGAKAGYQAYIGNRSETFLTSSAEATLDLSGGNILSTMVFYEYDFYPMKLGIDFNVDFKDSTSSSFSGISLDSTGSSVNYSFDVYVPILLVDSLTVIPRGTVGTSGSSGSTSSTSNWAASLLARYAF